MARLSKHGAELLRVARETEETNPESSTDWNRLTRAYMADGKILEKFDVHFKADTFRPAGEAYSYGWKLGLRQLKPGINIREHVAKIAKKISETPVTAWKVISGGPAPVIISQSRIMAAIESGENAGFCKACGAQAYGVEPDARNYTCESCGQAEVYGAEEMLIAG
jgi:hypothetical protein